MTQIFSAKRGVDLEKTHLAAREDEGNATGVPQPSRFVHNKPPRIGPPYAFCITI